MRPSMTFEYTLSLLIAVGVGVYLFYALLRPERF
jgi:K+-transporting ATPase KdpF subunit